MSPDERARRFAREGWIATQLAALSDEQLDRVDELVTEFRIAELDDQRNEDPLSCLESRNEVAVIKPPKVDYAFVMEDVDDVEAP